MLQPQMRSTSGIRVAAKSYINSQFNFCDEQGPTGQCIGYALKLCRPVAWVKMFRFPEYLQANVGTYFLIFHGSLYRSLEYPLDSPAEQGP
jgi:hypothetical protein